MKLKRKWIVWTSLAVVLLIGGAIHWSIRQRMNREVDAILAAASAAGEPTTTDDLARWHRSFANSGNRAVALELAINELRVHPPDVPEKAALSPLARRTKWSSPEFALDEPLPEKVMDSVRMFVRTNGALFQRIEEITNAPRAAVFNLEWAHGYDLPLPHLSRVKDLTESLRARCYLNIAQGEFGNAFRDVDLMFRISPSLEVEPTLISQLVRLAMRSIAHRALNRLLCHSELTKGELTALAETIRSSPPTNAIVMGFIGERALGLHAFEKPSASLETPAFGSVAWHQDRLDFATGITELIEASKAPPLESLDRVALVEQRLTRQEQPAELSLMAMLKKHTKRKPVSRTLLLGLITGTAKGLDALSADRIALAAIGVELYRLEHKRLPRTLSDIASFASAGELIDPFTGQPLLYKTNGIGSAYAIYSVGTDRKDDGGPNINGEEPKPSAKILDTGFPVTLKRQQR